MRFFIFFIFLGNWAFANSDNEIQIEMEDSPTFVLEAILFQGKQFLTPFNEACEAESEDQRAQSVQKIKTLWSEGKLKLPYRLDLVAQKLVLNYHYYLTTRRVPISRGSTPEGIAFIENELRALAIANPDRSDLFIELSVKPYCNELKRIELNHLIYRQQMLEAGLANEELSNAIGAVLKADAALKAGDGTVSEEQLSAMLATIDKLKAEKDVALAQIVKAPTFNELIERLLTQRKGMPKGEYQESCEQCSLERDILTCLCVSGSKSKRQSSIDISDCNETINNDKGKLTCGPVMKPEMGDLVIKIHNLTGGDVKYTVEFKDEYQKAVKTVTGYASGNFIREVVPVPQGADKAYIYIGGPAVHQGVYDVLATDFPFEADCEVKKDGLTVYCHGETSAGG